MNSDEIAKFILSPEVIELFEVVHIDNYPEHMRMDIHLDERKVTPDELKDVAHCAYGFTDKAIIQDFPIRGKSVYLHLRRRKWLNKESGEIRTRHIDLTHIGTKLTGDFVAFLKATDRVYNA